MAISCDPSALANAARCFNDCSRGPVGQSVRVYLLCQIASVPPPTNPDIADASVFNDVIFTWTNPTPNAVSNQVWKSVNGGVFVLYATVAGSVSSFHDPLPLGATDFWTYKVRNISSNGIASFFTDTRSITGGIIKTGQADTSASFPDLVLCVTVLGGAGSLSFNNMLNLTSFSAPLLRRVDQNLTLANDGKLTSVNFASLVLVGADPVAGGSFFLDNCVLLPTFSAPLLQHVDPFGNGGNFHLNGCSALNSLNVNSLIHVGGDFQMPNTSLATISLPSYVRSDESLTFNDNPNLTSVSAPLLQACGTSMIGDNCPKLSSLTVPNLNDLSGGDFSIIGSGSNLTLNLPVLISVGGEVRLDNCTGLLAISAPVLNNVGGNFAANNCGALASINLNGLQTAGGFLQFGGISNAAVSLPALQSIGLDLVVTGLFTSFSAPALTSIGTTVNFSSPNVASIVMSGGVTIGRDIQALACGNLTTVNLAGAIFTNGFSVVFNNAKIVVGNSAAGTGIDGILRRCVASGVTTDTITLNGGTNAVPDAPGQADKATLIGAGNAVTTN